MKELHAAVARLDDLQQMTKNVTSLEAPTLIFSEAEPSGQIECLPVASELMHF